MLPVDSAFAQVPTAQRLVSAELDGRMVLDFGGDDTSGTLTIKDPDGTNPTLRSANGFEVIIADATSAVVACNGSTLLPTNHPLGTTTITGSGSDRRINVTRNALNPIRILVGPPVPAPASTCSVTADDTTTYTLALTVLPDGETVPTFEGASDIPTDQTWTAGTDIGTITLPTATEGEGALTYSITPDLPAGISFTAATRGLAGIPTTGLEETKFTYIATDADNSATAALTFNITVVDMMPGFGNETIAAQRYTLNRVIDTLTLPEATGGDVSRTYSLTPDLPPGISFTAATRELAGTPTGEDAFEETEFTYTATDADGDTATLMFNITVREFAVEPEEVKAEVETVATLVGAVQTGLTAGLVRSRFSVQPSSGVAGAPSGGATTSLTLPDNPRDLADILGGLALEHTADADSGGQYAVWVRGQYTSMDGDPTLNGITVNYDGNSSGIGVGAEKSTRRYVAGVAVNWLTTDLDISSSSDDTTLSKYEESLVMVAPYVSLRRGARTFWFSGGYGIGDADATLEEGEGKASADVEVSFASAGADFVLSERGKNRIVGGLSVLGTRKVVDPLNFAAADVVIPKITLNTFRAQGEITYSRTVQAGEGRVVRPYIGVATLHDAGDRINDDSHAMDLRGGVDFDGARFDVSLEASTELLREDHESWSVSGSARYQFDPGGRGASLALDGIGGDASDIGLEGGYGMMMRQVHRDALLTPFAGIRHGSDGGEMSSGMRLAIGDDTDADFRATRAFRDDEDTLKLTFRRTF